MTRLVFSGVPLALALIALTFLAGCVVPAGQVIGSSYDTYHRQQFDRHRALSNQVLGGAQPLPRTTTCYQAGSQVYCY